jgi:hypothetical protein
MIYMYMKILKKGGVVEKRGRRKRNPCPMRLWKLHSHALNNLNAKFDL